MGVLVGGRGKKEKEKELKIKDLGVLVVIVFTFFLMKFIIFAVLRLIRNILFTISVITTINICKLLDLESILHKYCLRMSHANTVPSLKLSLYS